MSIAEPTATVTMRKRIHNTRNAAYTLWMIKRVVFGEVASEKVAALKDINRREFFILGVLAIAVLLVGLWPAPLLEVMHATVDHLVQQVSQSKL